MALVPGGGTFPQPLPYYAASDIVGQLVRELAPSVKQAVNAGVQAGASSRSRRMGSNKGSRKMPKQGAPKQQSKNQQSNPTKNTMSLGKTVSLGNADSMRVQQKDVVTINNTTVSGVCNLVITCGLASTVAGASNYLSLGTAVPRLSTLGGLYRGFKLNSISYTWIPNQGYTASGSVCMGVDPSPLSGLPSSYGSVLHHSSSKMFDVKAGTTVTWKPQIDSKSGTRYTTATTGLDEDELSFAVFQLYSTNGIAASTNIGNLIVSADITYVGAM